MKKVIFLSILCLMFFTNTKISLAIENDLVISEIMYDLTGSDAGHEWIEVYNSGQEELEVLTGGGTETWRFFDGANHTLNLVQGEDNLIMPQEYFILAADAEQFLLDYPEFTGTIFDTVMNLANTTGAMALSFDGGQTQTILANYDSTWGGSGNGFSLEKINLTQDSSQNNWQESFITGGTPGTENSLPDDNGGEENNTLQAIATCPSSLLVNEVGTFDASQSIAPENSSLNFLWDFLDETTADQIQVDHAWQVVGNYAVSLTVSSGELTDSTTCVVEVTEIEDDGSENNGGENNGGGNSGGGGNPPPLNHWSDLIISEFLPNPSGSDDGEWIELYNKGSQNIDLGGFKLQDNSARVFTVAEDDNLQIASGAYLVLNKNLTGISLNNTGGDAVKLYDPEGQLLELVEYLDTAVEDKSYARENTFNNNFLWTAELTPGSANIFLANLKPQAKIILLSDKLVTGEKIILSATDSSDPEEGELEYFWDFGDETNGDENKENHIYQTAGKYLVKLKVTDSEGLTDEASLLLNITAEDPELKITDLAPVNFTLEDLIISEFIPNPVGSDDEEWIEIYNNFSESIDLLAWSLDDQDGGSKPYLFSTSTVLLPGEFKIFSRTETGLTLNNNEDSVRLLTPLQEVWQEVNYNKIPEGQSFAWDLENKEWFINLSPSPGENNNNLQIVAGFNILNAPAVYDLKTKDKVFLQGLAVNDVTSKDSSLYLVDWEGDDIFYQQAVEVYFSKKDWPEIKAGDLVEVSGEISKTEPLPRVKIKNKEDIVVSEFHQDLNYPELISLDDLSEDLLGDFLYLKGVIVKKSGKNIYLASEAEEDWQVRVYANFDLTDLELTKGKEMAVTGFLSETSSGFKLTPLAKKDLTVSQAVEASDLESSEQAEISNQVHQEENIQRSKQVKKNLLLIMIGGVILVLVFLLKNKLNKKSPTTLQ